MMECVGFYCRKGLLVNTRWLVRAVLALYLLTLIGLLTLQVSAFQPDSDTQTVTVTTRRLNVRESPQLSSAILTVVHRGETYTVIGRSSDELWWQIQVNDLSGWVVARYVTVSTASATLSPWPTAICPYD